MTCGNKNHIFVLIEIFIPYGRTLEICIGVKSDERKYGLSFVKEEQQFFVRFGKAVGNLSYIQCLDLADSFFCLIDGLPPFVRFHFIRRFWNHTLT